MKTTKRNIILSALSLIVGGSIYILTRPDSHIAVLANGIIPLPKIQGYIYQLNIDAIKNFLPDFLWAFSFTCAFFVITRNRKHVILIVALCGILWESLQFTGIISGTGDIIDVIMYLTAVYTAVLINKKECSDHEKEQN